MTKDLPPYPRFGECISILTTALDIKKKTGAGADVGRLAREGDFDWETLDAVISDLLVDGSARVVGDAARTIIGPWLSEVRDAYTRLVLDVPLDTLSRSGSLPILVDEFFAPAAATLLKRASREKPGPDLLQLLDEDRLPVAVTLEWLDSFEQQAIEKSLYPGSTGQDRVDHEKVRKWRNGVDLPSSQSIILMCQHIQTSLGGAARAHDAALWLTLASALTRIEVAWGGSLRPRVAQHLGESDFDGLGARSRLVELVQRVGNTWPELAEAGRKLWYDLRRTVPKQPGDQDRIWCALELLEIQAETSDPQGCTAYHYKWMRGRWHVLSGQYQKALPYYEQAFEFACYRAGHQIKDLIEEATCIAAFLEKKSFLKRLKHVGIALGLFRKPDDENVLEEWEFEQFAHQLPILFPLQGRYIECDVDLSEQPSSGLMAISKEEIAKNRPDLKTLNRVRAVHFSNGVLRRWPQLRMFASFGMAKQVKTLLDAGAPVDDLDSSGGSALLCALQYAEATGEREVLDLLLAMPHQVATLNTATRKKRLTPLMCAIDFGKPDIVEALLAQKVDVEKRALTDNQSALYYLTTQLHHKLNPNRMRLMLTDKLKQEPDLILQDTLRRFGVGVTGVFGADTQMLQAHPDLVVATVRDLVGSHAAKHTFTNLMKIAELLLNAGANPNAAHRYPVAGRTPLMLAAESDLPELFDLMLRHEGNPLLRDSMGKDCLQIAMAFGSRKVWNCLQQKKR